jgi:hypothetical protein
MYLSVGCLVVRYVAVCCLCVCVPDVPVCGMSGRAVCGCMLSMCVCVSDVPVCGMSGRAVCALCCLCMCVCLMYLSVRCLVVN